MVSKIWTVNSLLCVFMLIFSIKAYDVWLTDKFDFMNDPILDSQQKQKKRLVANVKDMPDASYYNGIVEKNLFFPDRTGSEDIVSPSAAQAPGQKISNQDIFLYGVVIAGNGKKALIGNPYPETDADKTLWVKAGDSVCDDPAKSEIMVKRILKDKIVISIDGKEFDCYLYQKKEDGIQSDRPKIDHPDQDKTKQQNKTKQQKIKRDSSSRKDPAESKPELSFEISPNGKYKIYDTPFGKIRKRIK